MKNIFIISLLIIPCIILSQEVLIKPLTGNINTTNAEINFIQINDSSAYFTSVVDKNGSLESNFYTANFANGYWYNKKYSKYNSDIFNTANISFLGSWRTFFNTYNNEMKDCQIVYTQKNMNKDIYQIPAIYSENFFNTQPFIMQQNSQKVLYFVSNRNGGFGGLDIWLSIIDNFGNFGKPINAGSKINSSSDEITPFYNMNDSMMYFSSNRKGGLGGFDIYRTAGSLNFWAESKNVVDLNTIKDEMYLTFYDKNNGFFASNRKGAKFKSTEYCCNDIFSFKYQIIDFDTIKNHSEIHNYLPLNLYFHNDEPDPNTLNTSTIKSYKDAYISYFMMKTDYERQNLNIEFFFEDILQQNFNTLNKVLEILLFDLSVGNKMELQIKGYSSPLHNPQYNKNLSQRRISSLINYISQFNNGIFKEYISSRKLIIMELPFGERNSSEKVSDDVNDKKKSVYSIEAMLERKIKIIDVILKE